jgi:Uma2 family endonuclease
MPRALFESVAPPPLESVPRKKWTRSEVEQLISMGWSAKRYELIDGELIDKHMGKNYPHLVAVLLMHEWLIGIFGFRRIQREGPVNVAAEDNERNEPEPDLAVLIKPLQELGRKPQRQDILLAIEVAASTLAMDLSTKADLYARADIPDYWVLDLNERRMIVHRAPRAGKYTSIVAYREDESVAPLASPESELKIAAAFGE